MTFSGDFDRDRRDSSLFCFCLHTEDLGHGLQCFSILRRKDDLVSIRVLRLDKDSRTTNAMKLLEQELKPAVEFSEGPLPAIHPFSRDSRRGAWRSVADKDIATWSVQFADY